MYKYAVLVRITDYRTANTVVWADNDYSAKQLAEAQYGVGNVLSYTQINE